MVKLQHEQTELDVAAALAPLAARLVNVSRYLSLPVACFNNSDFNQSGSASFNPLALRRPVLRGWAPVLLYRVQRGLLTWEKRSQCDWFNLVTQLLTAIRLLAQSGWVHYLRRGQMLRSRSRSLTHPATTPLSIYHGDLNPSSIVYQNRSEPIHDGTLVVYNVLEAKNESDKILLSDFGRACRLGRASNGRIFNMLRGSQKNVASSEADLRSLIDNDGGRMDDHNCARMRHAMRDAKGARESWIEATQAAHEAGGGQQAKCSWTRCVPFCVHTPLALGGLHRATT